MEQLSESIKQKIVEKLKEKGASLPCPRCGNNSFTLLDGYFNQAIQTNFKGMVIGGPSVPTIGVACTNCGHISQHALGALGLLPEKESNSE